MNRVGINLFVRLRVWVIQASQWSSGFIFYRRIRSLVVPILVGLFPIALTVRIIRGNWTSVPYGDEWWTPGRQIISFFQGTLRFADLLQQHNESRPLFPNLYCLLMAAVSGRWDVKDSMVLMSLLVCIGSLFLYALLRSTTSFDLPGRLWAWVLLNAVLFCPREYENFLWGTILLLLTPAVALLGALLISLSELRLRWKILANSALAFIATYSFANGMLLWVLAAPTYPRQPRAGIENRTGNLAGWYAFYALCGIFSVGLYFYHYVHPRQHPPFAVSFADTLPLLRFLLSWVGALFVVPGASPLFFGCIFLVAFAALAIAALRVARRQGNFRRFYPWLVIAIYALASGAITASGRMRFGIGSATASRYAAVVVFFYVGLAGLALSLYDALVTSRSSITSRKVFIAGLTIGVVSGGWLSSFNAELSRVKVIREERKDLALAVQWIPAIPDNPDLALAKVPPNVVAKEATALSEYDALRPRLITQPLAAIVRQNPAPEDSSAGALESARFSDDHHLLLTGMAWLPYRNARADCVVVGYTNSDGGLTPLTVFQPTYKRERLKERFDIKHLAPNGFAASIDPGNLPKGTLTLRAWAVDMRAQRVLPMAGSINVHNEQVENNSAISDEASEARQPF